MKLVALTVLAVALGILSLYLGSMLVNNVRMAHAKLQEGTWVVNTYSGSTLLSSRPYSKIDVVGAYIINIFAGCVVAVPPLTCIDKVLEIISNAYEEATKSL